MQTHLASFKPGRLLAPTVDSRDISIVRKSSGWTVLPWHLRQSKNSLRGINVWANCSYKALYSGRRHKRRGELELDGADIVFMLSVDVNVAFWCGTVWAGISVMTGNVWLCKA